MVSDETCSLVEHSGPEEGLLGQPSPPAARTLALLVASEIARKRQPIQQWPYISRTKGTRLCLVGCTTLVVGIGLCYVFATSVGARQNIGNGGEPADGVEILDGLDGGTGPPVRLMETAKGGGILEMKFGAAMETDFPFLEGPTVEIDANKVDQEILGFGGAFTEASAVVFNKLSSKHQEQFLDLYFGIGGIGYTMGRVHINSCDFSVKGYTYDDHPEDFTLDHFDEKATHDSEMLIPLIKRAKLKVEQNGHALRLLASPWSPPAWMKENGKMDTSGRPCMRKDTHDVWARYMSKWISAYKAQEIPIWAVTVQNEPQVSITWEACLLTPTEEADFLGIHLGPTLKKDHPDVAIFVYDDNKFNMKAYAHVAFKHPTAAQYVSGIAFHWYTGDFFGNVESLHQEYPNAMLLSSEATYEKRMWKPEVVKASPDWRFGEGYAHDILGDLNAGAMGWIDWNLLLDEHGGPNHKGNMCDAAMIGSDSLVVHPQYYFIGHFSRFILPGSKRLALKVHSSTNYTGPRRPYGTCTADDGLQATAALRQDNKVAVVVLNCADNAVTFKIHYGINAIRSSIPAHAIQTYLFDA